MNDTPTKKKQDDRRPLAERYKTIFQAGGKWYTLTATVRTKIGNRRQINLTFFPNRNCWKDRDILFIGDGWTPKEAIIEAWGQWYREEVYSQIDQRHSPCRPEDIEIPAALADNFKKF